MLKLLQESIKIKFIPVNEHGKITIAYRNAQFSWPNSLCSRMCHTVKIFSLQRDEEKRNDERERERDEFECTPVNRIVKFW